MEDTQTYSAFLSYARADEKLADRLQTALETYRLPLREDQADSPTSLGRIFRDRTELVAGADLGDLIGSALARSHYLIVLVSEASRGSRWVGEELRSFIALHGTDRVLCASACASPQTLLPDALVATGTEPLIADISSSSFRTGVAQIVAAMSGLGLDDLLDRDLRRLRRRVMAVTASAAVVLLAMGAATWNALDARATAEERRMVAESQIEFMITDLKDDLQAVGRLEPLNAVGARALDYYDRYPADAADGEALARQARVFHLLGETADNQGERDRATSYFERAHEATRALLDADPDNPHRVFDHAQSSFWVGQSAYQAQKYGAARAFFSEYLVLAERLAELEGPTKRARAERLYGLSNLNAVALAEGDRATAESLTARIVSEKAERLAEDPSDAALRISLVNSLMASAKLHLDAGRVTLATDANREASRALQIGEKPDFDELLLAITVQRSLANLRSLSGEADAAEGALADAQRLMDIAERTEDGHADLRFEKAQLAALDYRLAYLSGDFVRMEEARSALEEVVSGLANDAVADFQYRAVISSWAGVDLLHAIAVEDMASAAERSRALLAMPSDNVPLSLTLLAHAALGTDPGDLSTCEAVRGSSNYIDAGALAAFKSDPACLPDGTEMPRTTLSMALARLRTSRSPVPKEITERQRDP